MMFIVRYVDDDNRKHITFVKTYREIRFIQERFGAIDFEVTNTFKIDKREDRDE